MCEGMKCSFTSRKCLHSSIDVRCESEEIRGLHGVDLCLNMHQLQVCSALTSVRTDQKAECSTEPMSTCWRRKELRRLSGNEFPTSDSWKVALLPFLEGRRVGSNGPTIPASIF